MRPLAVLWDFFLDLVIGDDPKIAVAVVLALSLAAALFVTGVVGASLVAVVGAATVVGTFTVSLLIDTHSARR
ncbi:MAG: hypothetical protein H0V07_09365 [Propionibacteriales bacterium]|nr:hypothetical protein [Propionibacteriales bacterium]